MVNQFAISAAWGWADSDYGSSVTRIRVKTSEFLFAGAAAGVGPEGVGAVPDHVCVSVAGRGGRLADQGPEAEDLGGGRLL